MEALHAAVAAGGFAAIMIAPGLLWFPAGGHACAPEPRICCEAPESGADIDRIDSPSDSRSYAATDRQPGSVIEVLVQQPASYRYQPDGLFSAWFADSRQN